MEEGRKRVLGIIAGILVARHLKTTEDLQDSRPSPRTESLVASAVQWAERIMRRIDGTFADSADGKRMAASLEETLISVWRQALVDEAKTVTLEGRNFPVRRTNRSRLREVDFLFKGHALRGLEQNPKTGSRWAWLAHEGKKVMQFLRERRYVAVVVDGKVQFYGKAGLDDLERQV